MQNEKQIYDFLDESLREIQKLIKEKNVLFKKHFKVTNKSELYENLIDYSLDNWDTDPEWVISVARAIIE